MLLLSQRFHELDKSGDGLLSLEEFTVALDLKDAAPGYAARLFSFFDADGSGAISYAEFVNGLAMISPETTADEKVKLAFLLCDVDASGGVSLSNLLSLIGYAQSHDIKVPGVTAASPKSDDASAVAPKQPPMLKRSATSMSRAFDAYDDSGEKVLSFDQFRAFLKANPDVLSLSTALLQDKLKNAELLKPMEDAVNRIKQERTERKGA